ncbi:MFS general substrate transporter [Apiospora hydei]|uniref:MFS general substrate transporter n=1 Tax=Apiospora hydei TaxID=1337664 RepID=A0ABR1WZ55_9PEZI
MFWFLVTITGPCLVLVILGLPETARSVIGNGSLPPPIYCRLPMLHPRFMRHWKASPSTVSRGKRRRSLRVLLRRDNTVVVLASALMYTVYSCVIASLSTLFIEIYGLNQWQAGLVYLPFGIGGTFSTFVSGPLLDWAYRNARSRHDLPGSPSRDDNIDEFPTERARLSIMWAPVLVTLLCILTYGWALHERWHLAVPLTLQFVVGFALQFNFSGFNTLISDINHAAPSAANASMAVVRCGLAALAVAYLEDLLQAIDVGWTFTCISGLSRCSWFILGRVSPRDCLANEINDMV